MTKTLLRIANTLVPRTRSEQELTRSIQHDISRISQEFPTPAADAILTNVENIIHIGLSTKLPRNLLPQLHVALNNLRYDPADDGDYHERENNALLLSSTALLLGYVKPEKYDLILPDLLSPAYACTGTALNTISNFIISSGIEHPDSIALMQDRKAILYFNQPHLEQPLSAYHAVGKAASKHTIHRPKGTLKELEEEVIASPHSRQHLSHNF